MLAKGWPIYASFLEAEHRRSTAVRLLQIKHAYQPDRNRLIHYERPTYHWMHLTKEGLKQSLGSKVFYNPYVRYCVLVTVGEVGTD